MSLYEKVSSLLSLDSDLKYISNRWFDLENGNYTGGLPKTLEKKYLKADDLSDYLGYLMLKTHKMLEKQAKKNKIPINNELYRTFEEVIFDMFGDGGLSTFGDWCYNSRNEKITMGSDL